MNKQQLFEAIKQHAWTEELIAETELTPEEKDQLRQLSKTEREEENSLMIAFGPRSKALKPLYKLISTLDKDQQKNILLQQKTLNSGNKACALSRLAGSTDEEPESIEIFSLLMELFITITPPEEQIETLKEVFLGTCGNINSDQRTATEIICDQVATFPLDTQMQIALAHKNNLLRASTHLRSFPRICQIFEEFPAETLVTALTSEASVLERAIYSMDLFPEDRKYPSSVESTCKLIKKIPQPEQINIFTNKKNSSDPTIFNRALDMFANYYVLGIPWNRVTEEQVESEKKAFFTDMVSPLLTIIQDFPLEVKEKIYNEIPTYTWYSYLSSAERKQIRDAIGVYHPFNTSQQIGFNLAASVSLSGGALWLLMATGSIASTSFIAAVWPIAITATATGLGAMLALNIYANRNNPLQAYAPTATEEMQPLLGNKAKTC